MIGIVILNYETWDASLQCMQSIEEAKTKERYRIYLVDNASKKHCPKNVMEYIRKHNISFIRAEENKGYSAGNNIGIRQAQKEQCDAVLIVNNDIIFQKYAIQSMYDFLKRHPKAGIVGPKVTGMDGQVQPSAISCKTGIKEIFLLYTAAKLVFRRKWKKYFCLDRKPDEDFQVYHVSGCCFMISSECAERVTPLDENTFLYDEELILGIRMEQEGFETWYHPKSVVEHHHGYTTRKMKPFMYQCICNSEQYYCREYLGAKKWQLWVLRKYRRTLYYVRYLKKLEENTQ